MGIFSVPPDLPVTKSKEEIDKTYRYWRLHLMITSYIVFISPTVYLNSYRVYLVTALTLVTLWG